MESISGRGKRKIYSTVQYTYSLRETQLTKTGIRKLQKCVYIRTYVYCILYTRTCVKSILGFIIMLCQLSHRVEKNVKKGEINTYSLICQQYR
jgi:hypothetical protein